MIDRRFPFGAFGLLERHMEALLVSERGRGLAFLQYAIGECPTAVQERHAAVEGFAHDDARSAQCVALRAGLDLIFPVLEAAGQVL